MKGEHRAHDTGLLLGQQREHDRAVNHGGSSTSQTGLSCTNGEAGLADERALGDEEKAKR